MSDIDTNNHDLCDDLGHHRDVVTSLKWFNRQKGFGFVVPEDEAVDAFLHITKLQAAGVSALGDDARLRCRVVSGEKGAQVCEVLALIDEGTNPHDIGTFKSSDFDDDCETEKISGVVKWYNNDKGFGFIMADDGEKDVFVHKACLERQGINLLAEGQRVSAEIKIVPKGREAVSIEFKGQ